MPIEREGPYKVEIQRGSWEERLSAMLREERARRPGASGMALVVEGREGAARLAGALLPHLGPSPHRIDAPSGLLLLSEHLDALKALDGEREGGLLAVAVVGAACRKDGIQAAWKLEGLKDRLWVLAHEAVPPSGLVPTVGQHVRRYLEVIEGLAFSEGPGDR